MNFQNSIGSSNLFSTFIPTSLQQGLMPPKSLIVGTLIFPFLVLAGCSDDSSKSQLPESADANPIVSASSNQAEAATGHTEFAPVDARDSIPYPVYPNGSRYRIGGENGLKIVVFETKDGFEDVDAYFRQALNENSSLARQVLMPDYVKYSTREESDEELWKNDAPGIVIHQFADAGEASTLGAAPGSRTNIIMSFR